MLHPATSPLTISINGGPAGAAPVEPRPAATTIDPFAPISDLRGASLPPRPSGAPRFLSSTAAQALVAPGDKLIVLHVGSGPADQDRLHPEFRTPEWREVRVDLDEAAAPDLLASMTDLSPVPSGSVHAIYCHHSLEHLPAHEVPRALAEFTRVLRPRGIALLCTPDLQRIGELLVAERLHEAAYVSPAGPISALDMVYGHGASIAAGQALMAHRTGFTGNTLGQALLAAGFADVEVNRVGFDLWVLASMTAPAA